MQATVKTSPIRSSIVTAAAIGVLAVVAIAMLALNNSSSRSGAQQADAPAAVEVADRNMILNGQRVGLDAGDTSGTVTLDDARAPKIATSLLPALDADLATQQQTARTTDVYITADGMLTLDPGQAVRQQTDEANQLVVTSDALFAMEAAYDMAQSHGLTVQPATSDSQIAIGPEQIARMQAVDVSTVEETVPGFTQR